MGLIYLDSCLLIYLLEGDAPTSEAVRNVMRSSAMYGISPLVKSECLVGPLKLGDSGLRHDYMELFGRFASLELPEPVYFQAAELRARFGLKTPDALHLACAQHHRCEALWTSDGRLARASHGLAVNILAGQSS